MEVEGNTELIQVKPKRIINLMLGEVSGNNKNFLKAAIKTFELPLTYCGISNRKHLLDLHCQLDN